ncbi:SRPBCC family protein [Nitriliruptor alkaliphilus]|uniref:SRPBCC family protein n=1 Tax=Nitriliruptor alkaliphilus TaxID=427918 RepID=UPI00069917FE|nr:SRPBCC family protein [Nitriliruptor alkaliphilus]
MSDTIRLDQPPAEVFDLLTDPEELAVWSHAFDHAEQLDPGPLRVGSRVRAGARVDGRPGDLVFEIVDLRATEVLEVEGRSDDVRTRARLTIRPCDGGSEVTATSRAVVDDEDDDLAVEPEANPAFADVAGSLLRGLEAALGERPSQAP